MPRVDRRLPDFLIGGAQKAGTTSLHALLDENAQVFLPKQPQEIHFFDIDQYFSRGVHWYAKFFQQAAADHLAVGQTCPTYLYEADVPERIAKVLPDVRLIFLLRNPVDRAYSHYWHSVKYGFENLSFEQAVDCEEERLARNPRKRFNLSYLDRGRYARQLERYLQCFSREQILLLLTEDLEMEPSRVLDRCFSFLGVALRGEEIARKPRVQWNASRLPRWRGLQTLTARVRSPRKPHLKRLARLVDRLNLRTTSYPPMAPAVRRRLEEEFSEENRRLEELFQLDLTPWCSRGPRGGDSS